jgi:hypothetical protein
MGLGDLTPAEPKHKVTGQTGWLVEAQWGAVHALEAKH